MFNQGGREATGIVLLFLKGDAILKLGKKGKMIALSFAELADVART